MRENLLKKIVCPFFLELNAQFLSDSQSLLHSIDLFNTIKLDIHAVKLLSFASISSVNFNYVMLGKLAVICFC